MTWLDLDDGILDHPKFIRAAKLGGSEAIHLWLGLRSYCGKYLTDGYIPKDMLDEVRGPREPVARAAALAALIEVGLLDEGPEAVEMHDFLDWSSSREQVLKARSQTRDRVGKYRNRNAVTTSVTHAVTNADVTHRGGEGDGDGGGDRISSSFPDLSEPGSGTFVKADSVPPPPANDVPRGLARELAPTSPQDALRLPIAERARLVLEDPANGAWSAPQGWPEVVAVAEALAKAAGWPNRPRLGDMSRDNGVRAVLRLLADGWPPDELIPLMGSVARSKWWRDGGAKLGLSSITGEVLRRTQNDRPGRTGGGMDPEIAREIARTRALVASIGQGGS